MDLLNALAHAPSPFPLYMIVIIVGAAVLIVGGLAAAAFWEKPAFFIVAFFIAGMLVLVGGYETQQDSPEAYSQRAVGQYVLNHTDLVPMTDVAVRKSHRSAKLVAVTPDGGLVDVSVSWLPVDTKPAVPGSSVPAGFNPVTITTAPHDPAFMTH